MDSFQENLQKHLEGSPLAQSLLKLRSQRQQSAARNLELRAAFFNQDEDYFRKAQELIERNFIEEAQSEDVDESEDSTHG